METCESCRFYFPVDKSGSQGECREKPPKIFVFPKGSPFAGAPPEIVLQSLWPPVKSGAWCGRYENKLKWTGLVETQDEKEKAAAEAWEKLDREKPLNISEDKKTLKLADGD